MNEFCAAMGLCNLRHVDEEIEKRKKVVKRYRSHLEGVEGIQLNVTQKDVKSNYAYFPILCEEKHLVLAERKYLITRRAWHRGKKIFLSVDEYFFCFSQTVNVVGDTSCFTY